MREDWLEAIKIDTEQGTHQNGHVLFHFRAAVPGHKIHGQEEFTEQQVTARGCPRPGPGCSQAHSAVLNPTACQNRTTPGPHPESVRRPPGRGTVVSGRGPMSALRGRQSRVAVVTSSVEFWDITSRSEWGHRGSLERWRLLARKRQKREKEPLSGGGPPAPCGGSLGPL